MFTPDELRELPEAISGPRFATYLRASGNDHGAALALYQWNLEVSSAFLVPLQICEVAVRNGIVEAIERVHGPNWPWSNGFARSLPVPKDPYRYHAAKNLRAVAVNRPTVGKVVAELNFAFWETIFTRGQDNRLWVPHFHQVFPGAPAGLAAQEGRRQAYAALHRIRLLRNRIAHHEPVFSRDLADDYATLRRLIGWRRPSVAAWTDKVQRVSGLLAARP